MYTKALDGLKTYQEVANARFEAARGTEVTVHKVSARQPEVEIALEWAKIKKPRGRSKQAIVHAGTQLAVNARSAGGDQLDFGKCPDDT